MFFYNLKKHEKDGSFTSMMFLLKLKDYVEQRPHTGSEKSENLPSPQLLKNGTFRESA